MPHRDMDQELVGAAQAGGARKVSKLLACGANPRKKDSCALRWAAHSGHVECVRLLLPTSDPMAEDSYALRAASQNGHAECVKMLLTVSDPKALDSQALKVAAKNGHEQCVRMLRAVSGPLGEIDGLLEKVFELGHAKVAALMIEEEPGLLDGINLPKRLAEALKNSHADMASYLSAIIDQRALSGIDQNRPASRPVSARL